MKISVIIPVYKTEQYISRCIDSVLNQSYDNFEIIIVDDCSPDNAISIAESYASVNSSIKIVRHETNRGLMVSRQTGYSNATGDYFMFVDSDDTIPKNALSILAKEVQSNQSQIVIAGHTKIDENGREISEDLPLADGVFKPEQIFCMLLEKKVRHNLAFCLFSKELFKYSYITIENQTNGEDLILFYQLAKQANHISVIRQSVYNYYQTPGSSTNSGITSTLLKQLVNVQNFIYDFLRDFGIPENAILGYILPGIPRWYLTPGGKEIADGLRPAILNATKFKASSKILPLKAAAYISLSRNCPSLINYLRKFKHLLMRMKH